MTTHAGRAASIRNDHEVSTRQLNAIHHRILELIRDEKTNEEVVHKTRNSLNQTVISHHSPVKTEVYQNFVSQLFGAPADIKDLLEVHVLPESDEMPSFPETVGELKSILGDMPPRECLADIRSLDSHMQKTMTLTQLVAQQILEELPRLLASNRIPGRS